MGAIDVVFAVLLGLSIVWGFWRGLTRELVSMIAWVIIGVLVYRYSSWVGQWLPFEAPPVVHVAVGAGVIVVLGVIAAAIIGRLLRSAVTASKLAGADRVLGALFGAARGALVMLLIAALVVEAGFSDTHVWRNSASGPYLEHVWHWMAGTVPNHRVPLVMVSGG
ncbi:putative colicin V production protein [Burkholderiales bacterium]|nr:putative colicin V production protein [Burkholderiales bacterium]